MFSHTLLKDKQIFIAFGSGFFINAAMWGLIWWRSRLIADDAVIHYTTYFGIDWLGPAWHLFYYPGLGLLLLLINIGLCALYFALRRCLEGYIFAWLAVFLNVLLLVVSVIMLLVNV